jgi:NAD(P)-dependent dehydrogenase (short-subunit alcohol dehydrogenase family)
MMSGNVAIVTGGAGGIGSEVCRASARQGTAVAVADADAQRAEEVTQDIASAGGSALALGVDVTSEESIASAVERAAGRFGRIDYLVHCAGNNIKASVLEMSLEQWQSVLDTHLTGAFLFCQAVGKQLVKQDEGGRIVLMSSVAATAPVPERGAYSPAKAGLVSLAGMLALEWAQYNINVNAVCPAVALTPMTEMVYRREPELRAQRLKRTPMGREVLPREIADLVLFLCSDKASYINGTAIPIDGAFLHNAFMQESE